MLRNCKVSTLLLGAMFITGVMLYGMLGSLFEATWIIALVMWISFLILMMLDMRYFSSIVLVAVSEVTMLAFGLYRADSPLGVLVFLALTSPIVLCVSLAPAVTIRDEGDKEHPVWLQALSAIPGIGAIIGSSILFYRQWQRFRELAGWV